MGGGTVCQTYHCRNCQTALAVRNDLESKKFQGSGGKAYLFSHAMNFRVGCKKQKQLLTGQYVVAGICCSGCLEEVGWRYEQAYEATQKFKEGKFVIETKKIAKEY